MHLNGLEKLKNTPPVDAEKYSSVSGKSITIAGTNKCQCGLDIASLSGSCELGHLHHLEAEDGQIYHYLQQEKSTDLFHGTDSHFKQVKIQGTVFPGNFIAVHNREVR